LQLLFWYQALYLPISYFPLPSICVQIRPLLDFHFTLFANAKCAVSSL
jgi:hypothetical protein